MNFVYQAPMDVLAPPLTLFSAPSRVQHHHKRCSNSFALVCTSGCQVAMCDLPHTQLIMYMDFLFPQHPGVFACKLTHTQKFHECAHIHTLYHPPHGRRGRKWANNPMAWPTEADIQPAAAQQVSLLIWYSLHSPTLHSTHSHTLCASG